MKTDFLDPRTTPRPTASNPGPKTLSEAREHIEVLEAQLLQLRGSATAPKPVLTVPAPMAKPATPTPTAARPNPVPMPVNVPPPPKLTLSPDLDSPVKIQAVLDQMNLDDLRLALNGEKDGLRIRCLYLEIKKRENLMSVQN